MSTVKEAVDVQVPVHTAYDQWNQFEEFPHFMEGVEEVRQTSSIAASVVAVFQTCELPPLQWRRTRGARHGVDTGVEEKTGTARSLRRRVGRHAGFYSRFRENAGADARDACSTMLMPTSCVLRR
ncbi:hypothetical protein STENM327S_07760 [Streptomyces tendae]